MPTLSFHTSEPVARRLRQRARAAKLPLSAFLAATVERGLVHEPPKRTRGFMQGLFDSTGLDPSRPVFAPGDWKD
jgi:hypothetical protein